MALVMALVTEVPRDRRRGFGLSHDSDLGLMKIMYTWHSLHGSANPIATSRQLHQEQMLDMDSCPI